MLSSPRMPSRKTTSPHYGYPCDYCPRGRVHCEVHDRELIRIGKSGYVALEGVPVGVCTRCKATYYHLSILKQASSLLRKPKSRTLRVRVARYVEAG